MVTLALLGDVMLGRLVGERLVARGPRNLFADDVVEVVRGADLAVANLECCISERGTPARKRFVFRAPPVAVEALGLLGVTAVTLANNHALDFGPDALLDTLGHLEAGGIRVVGAGAEVGAARAPVVLDAGGHRVAVLGFTDHPASFAATGDRPGVAHADLTGSGMLPAWVADAVAAARTTAKTVLVTPHWGPNMVTEPLPEVRRAAGQLRASGADLVAGHSAHVLHGAGHRVLYDLGDALDDYVRDPVLRNDLGLAALVTLDADGAAVATEVVPLKLEHCRTRLARGEDREWVRRRFEAACAGLGIRAGEVDGRIVVDWSAAA